MALNIIAELIGGTVRRWGDNEMGFPSQRGEIL